MNGSDSNSGASIGAPVKTLGKALELAEAQSPDYNIYVINTVTLSGSELQLSNGAYTGTIYRSKTFNGVLFNVPSTVTYVTIDGNKDDVPAADSLFNVIGGFLTISTNAVLQNNKIHYACRYVTESRHLKRFDQFTLEKYPDATCLSREIVLDWCSKQPHEAQENQCARASILRQFAKYLDTMGINAYILPKGYYPKASQYVPYIYSPEELVRFFAQTDQCHYSPECPYRHLIMPVFFRMIYQCGLRVSEARMLTVGDVDLSSGVLSIHHSNITRDCPSLGIPCRAVSG